MQLWNFIHLFFQIVIIHRLFILCSGGFPHFHQLVVSNSAWRTFSHYVLDTLGRIIFIHLLRSTVVVSLTKSNHLPRYSHINNYIIYHVYEREKLLHLYINSYKTFLNLVYFPKNNASNFQY